MPALIGLLICGVHEASERLADVDRCPRRDRLRLGLLAPNPTARPYIRQRATGPHWYGKWSRHGKPVVRAAFRFLRNLGHPRLVIIADGQRFNVRALQVTVANGPVVGAAYALERAIGFDRGAARV